MQKAVHELCRLVAAKDSEGRVPVVERGSAEWQAWLRWREDMGLPTTYWRSREWNTVPTLLPPADITLAIAKAKRAGSVAAKLRGAQ